MAVYNPSKTNWLNPSIEYLFNEEIIEYDIKDAGFSLIKQYRLLPPEKIRELESRTTGVDRHVAVGIMQRDDPEFSNRLGDAFTKIREWFIKANNLSDGDILSVKKDAIYTIGKCKHCSLGQVLFREKHQYSSYIRLPDIRNLELYFGEEGIDVKGMGEIAVNRHRLYLLDFIRKYFIAIENQDASIRRKFIAFINNYKFDDLEEEYYVEFNNMSKDIDKVFNYQNLLIPLLKIVLREVN